MSNKKKNTDDAGKYEEKRAGESGYGRRKVIKNISSRFLCKVLSSLSGEVRRAVKGVLKKYRYASYEEIFVCSWKDTLIAQP